MINSKMDSTPTVAFLGNYVPRRCGIATFTHDMFRSYTEKYPGTHSFVVSVEDLPHTYAYPEEVRWTFDQHDPLGYRRVADQLNASEAEVVCVQHEYGIYGGESGSYLLHLTRHLTKPYVVTLHTVLKEPTQAQRLVLQELAHGAQQVVVMSEKGADMLNCVFKVPFTKIKVIPHGVPDVPFGTKEANKEKLGLSGKKIVLTFGLLSPNKGIELAIRALPPVVEKIPDVLYVVLGATHPNLIREQGEAYRNELMALAKALGVERNVAFHNRFVDDPTLLEYLQASDVYLTPYLNEAQITSGTLAYSVGCGKAVVSTPYWHAQELLADGRGTLVKFGCHQDISQALLRLFTDKKYLEDMERKAYAYGRSMTWPQVAESYRKVYSSAGTKPAKVPKPALPKMKLDHLLRLTDSTGMIQHARYGMPYRQEGYCIDDNARALLYCVRLMDGTQEVPARLWRLVETYAAFVGHAFDEEQRAFRNFMSYERTWLERRGSDDSQGRTAWALGETVCLAKRPDLKQWASHYLREMLPTLSAMTSPRAWAFASIGLTHYLRYQPDEQAATLRNDLNARLMELYAKVATPEWEWFEEGLSYDNARLSQALLMSDNPQERLVGYTTLDWLMTVQVDAFGLFRPIGNQGFGKKRRECLTDFDQQPVEVWATVDACQEAYNHTQEAKWLTLGDHAFSWFLGNNRINIPMYNEETGACYDGIHSEGPNLNCGAESCLSYLAARLRLESWQYKQVILRSAPVAPTKVAAIPVWKEKSSTPGKSKPALSIQPISMTGGPRPNFVK
ncbi:glycosyltransferase family 4 protein [Rhabdobacter roseus]|uniref:Glycosyltransferase involved in cell wall biosynthesis n=1 Tax=Rhabdobacter roseus TaxID=1655419 RepID=A0A840TY48_9BACT|nr:glycosyltransferase [Rhabdobacter roseus]MBB5286532.1 glycosyltransferase involved in cell wall biosynthesis [Rhabdobacter roseus]